MRTEQGVCTRSVSVLRPVQPQPHGRKLMARFELFLARRYFQGKREGSRFLSFIKIMAITGVAVGTAGLLIALSIVHGFKSAIHEKVLGFAPHITITSATPDPLFRADTLATWI